MYSYVSQQGSHDVVAVLGREAIHEGQIVSGAEGA